MLAYAAEQHGIDLENESALQELASKLDFVFLEDEERRIRVLLDGKDVTAEIRTEGCGHAASSIGTLPAVRTALLERQRTFRKWPGLITDGRDMGTVIFPDAGLKLFLHASPEERAQRRYQQLKKQGIYVTVDSILQDLAARDTRDKQRGVAPLRPAADAIFIDATMLSIEQSLAAAMQYVRALLLVPDKRGL